MGNPLAELGLSSDDGTISIDHAIVFSVAKSLEEAICKTLVALTKSSKDVNRVMKIVGYAAASYLLMSGVAKIIEASKKDSSKKR